MDTIDSSEIGDIVGGYRLEELIGQGGMGRVFVGVHVKLGRRAAVKLLSPKYHDNKAEVGRFFQEARVVNDIGHPKIIDIIDFIEIDSPRRVACVMEYVRGPDLARVILDGPLPLSIAVDIALQLCDAFAAAHAIGVVHRDLKPANVLLESDPRLQEASSPSVKVVDFGIAKIVGGTKQQTQVGRVLGTPAYMAPEQLAGLAVGPPTDVYAIGEVFYEMLAGRPAFNGDIQSIRRLKITGELPTLDLPQAEWRRKALALVTRCISADPGARPSCDGLRTELAKLAPARLAVEREPAPQGPVVLAPDAVVATTTVESPSAGVEPARSPTQRRWVLVGLLATTLIAVVGVGSRLAPKVRTEPVARDEPAPATTPPEPAKSMLQSEPPGAHIFDPVTGELLGAAPFELVHTAGDVGHRLRVVLHGYQTQDVVITADDGDRIVRLVRVHTQRPRKPAPPKPASAPPHPSRTKPEPPPPAPSPSEAPPPSGASQRRTVFGDGVSDEF